MTLPSYVYESRDEMLLALRGYGANPGQLADMDNDHLRNLLETISVLQDRFRDQFHMIRPVIANLGRKEKEIPRA